MPIVQGGSYNPAALSAPSVVVQVLPPSQTLINGVPTNIIAFIGTAPGGPVNSPTVIGDAQGYTQTFGAIVPRKYDMGTAVVIATQQAANSMLCVRVTDGTDTYATKAILDGASAVGMTLTSKYTGSLYNSLQALISAGSKNGSYKITLSLPNLFPEVFDNITGSGATLWQNIVNAINLGQSNVRGPSQLCTAVLNNFLSGVTVTAPGSYATMPTLGTTGNGSGAVFAATMKAVAAVAAAAGTGYVTADTITLTGGTHTINAILTVANTKLVSVAVNAGGANYLVGDTITLAGGTFGTAAILTVATVSGGAVTGVTISNAGSYTVNTATFTQSATSGVGTGATFNTAVWGVNTVTVSTPGAYTVLPASPVAQGSTSGAGTGATFTTLWGLLSVAVSSPGLGYDSTSHFAVTGGGGTGGGAGTLSIGSANIPALASYTLTGGTDGANVTPPQLIGDDTATPRKGMYALRGTNADIVVLVDNDSSSTWTTQDAFGLQEGMYMIATDQAGQTIAQTIATKNSAGLDSYATKLMIGDWIYWLDTTNNQTRLVSPQSFVAGRLSNLSPQNSSLNNIIESIVGSQKSLANQQYSMADVTQMVANGLDVIINPPPGFVANYWATATGQNTSSNLLQNDDSYTRMTNFLALTFYNALGIYIGKPNSPDIDNQFIATLNTFLQNLKTLKIIAGFNVILQPTSNVYTLQCLVEVDYFHPIRNILINLLGGITLQGNNNGNVTIGLR